MSHSYSAGTRCREPRSTTFTSPRAMIRSGSKPQVTLTRSRRRRPMPPPLFCSRQTRTPGRSFRSTRGETKASRPRPAHSPGNGRRRRRRTWSTWCRTPSSTCPNSPGIRSPVPRSTRSRSTRSSTSRLEPRRSAAIRRTGRSPRPSRRRRPSPTTRTTGACARSTRTARPAIGTRDPRSSRHSPTTRSWTSSGSRICTCATQTIPAPMSTRARLGTRRTCPSSPGMPFLARRAIR